jgi:aldehyde:ferredoxin oxidoreductase
MMHERIAQPLKDGPTKGRAIPTEELVRYFWKSFGWDEETGKPTPETIEAHDLHALAEINIEG